jgi:flavin-dependent dehydrogenase
VKKNIIIVGAGSAGWMTAATLVKAFPKKDITVIESPNIRNIGVGESTLGQINEWLAFLEIEDEDFMSFTKASYKLSIRFEDFYKKGDGGFHYPFGPVFENISVGPKESWFFKKKFFPETTLSDYATSISTNMALVNNNVLFKNEDKKLPLFDFKRSVAYHFDASKFGEWLKEYYCKPKGVKHIIEEITSVQTNEEGIKTLNNKYAADLFIDCTGFKSLLLGKTLKEPFCDYSHLLPNNKAWSTSVPYEDKEKELKPYTNCTAIENGWVWNIPSWDKIGTGYVYSDKYISVSFL